MGQALAEALPNAEQYSRRPTRRWAPLSRVCFEGPDEQLRLTENAAGDSHGQRRRGARCWPRAASRRR